VAHLRGACVGAGSGARGGRRHDQVRQLLLRRSAGGGCPSVWRGRGAACRRGEGRQVEAAEARQRAADAQAQRLLRLRVTI